MVHLPNLLIIGAQKCGTTWLSRCLKKSAHFWGTRPKELHYWQRPEVSLEEYAEFFLDAPSAVEYRFEATPNYFRLPWDGIDIAARIRDNVGDVPLLLMLRDPIQRYRSAYTHHMARERVPLVTQIDSVDPRFLMVELGRYGDILEHYRTHFTRIHVHLYDDLVADPFGLAGRVFSDLDVPCDLTPNQVTMRPNAARTQLDKAQIEVRPVLTAPVRQELRAFYRDDVAKLQDLIGRDLSSWL